MASGIRIEGLDEFKKKFGRADAKVDEVLKATVKESAELVLPRLKTNTPKDTGNLQDSEEITYTNDGFTAEIGPDPSKAPYAIWVEQGHHTKGGSFVPGQHYLERTKIENEQAVKDKFIKAIRTLLN
jgi:HK97 gp10 family phage protein